MEPKLAAALHALEEVKDGMLLGLGTGSTSAFFIDALGEHVGGGLRVTAVATSKATAEQATAFGIPLLEHIDRPIDLTIDGADQIDPHLNLVKGLGGALLREKVVAAASRRMMVIATEEKLVPRLDHGLLPVEVLPLLWERTAAAIATLGLEPTLRRAGEAAFVTDSGNLILHCRLDGALEPAPLAGALDAIPGVMGHGLFLGIATEGVIAGPDGVRVLRPT